jgi:superfamily I DNA and/or RNA helicase
MHRGCQTSHYASGPDEPSIMIVEEAAEVLEAHIVAGLTASC